MDAGAYHMLLCLPLLNSIPLSATASGRHVLQRIFGARIDNKPRSIIDAVAGHYRRRQTRPPVFLEPLCAHFRRLGRRNGLAKKMS